MVLYIQKYGMQTMDRALAELVRRNFITKDQALASSSAKEVDLLVTWLFRLTQEQYNYKMAAVIGIMVFIICAVFTLVCFRFLNKKEATFS